MLGLLPHSYAYTPILFFRPLFAFIIIFGFINYFCSIRAKNDFKKLFINKNMET